MPRVIRIISEADVSKVRACAYSDGVMAGRKVACLVCQVSVVCDHLDAAEPYFNSAVVRNLPIGWDGIAVPLGDMVATEVIRHPENGVSLTVVGESLTLGQLGLLEAIGVDLVPCEVAGA